MSIRHLFQLTQWAKSMLLWRLCCRCTRCCNYCRGTQDEWSPKSRSAYLDVSTASSESW
jgi:hypothetical protein